MLLPLGHGGHGLGYVLVYVAPILGVALVFAWSALRDRRRLAREAAPERAADEGAS
jgi:hypothetical protein